jgi:YwiC-like protein
VLFPREHGAYGQLLFPLVCSLLVGHPAAGAYLLAAAGIAAFLAHESLLVVLGQRGARSARELRHEAWRSLALFGGFAAVCAAVALSVLSRVALVGVAVTVFLALAVAIAVAVGRERTTVGEMLVAVALASLSVPTALAGLVPMSAALTIFAVFASTSIAATVAVRSMIGRVSKGGGPPPILSVTLALAVVAALTLLALVGRLSIVAPYAALPVCAVSLGLAVRMPSPKHLRVIGWTLVGATALAAIILVAALA